MPSRSRTIHHIAPDCPAELDAMIRREAAARGETVMPPRPFPWNRPKRKPGPRVDLPGQLALPETDARPAELAKRQAAAPLRAVVHQKPCDHGLFGDDAKQVDLEDLL